jgi:tripartite-type tricarboxylate transporter receptor subunit TctC
MKKRRLIPQLAGMTVAAWLPAAMAAAQTDAVADFYRGKTMTLMVASGAGGGYDFFARTLAKHMGRHIPGNPTLIVQNMPGAGGARMVNFIYNVGAQDGTILGVPLAPAAMAQVLDPSPIKYDATKLQWIGNLENSVGILFVWHGSQTRTVADAMTRVTPLAGSGKSSATYQIPVLANALLGTKFNVVLGYPGAAEMENAIERGEVDGRAAVWQTLNTTQPSWIKDGKVRIVIQSVLKRAPQLPDVPTYIELAKTDEARRIFEFIAFQNVTGRTLVAPPGVPKQRIAALRRAFDAAVKDQVMLSELTRAGLEIDPSSGEEVQDVIGRMIATPPEIVAKMRKLLE